ncbi:MAG: P63C domain-containing protein [Paracoccaceae bacterium]|nr:P63C domain-containing protein [Paracoccaceae bacterium]
MTKSDPKKVAAAQARAEALSSERRREIAREAARVRWEKSSEALSEGPTIDEFDLAKVTEDVVPNETMPVAIHRGNLNIMGMDVPCYVLDNDVRVIGRTSATEVLTGIKGGGALEKYIAVKALEPFIPTHLVLERMVPFRLPEVEGLEKAVKGLPADLFIDICQGFVNALEHHYSSDSIHPKLTARQQQMAVAASMFLSACAKVGLEALIDEATGYQYERETDALSLKLAAFLEEDMRKWEKTFPDDLWIEFGRLTNWKGQITKRPKYWGKLVMELVYEKLDPDVAKWLKEHAPKPKHGQNYHQWLSSQYGLKKLVEHIWMIIGMAKTCETMTDLRDQVNALDGRHPVQLRMYLPRPGVE